MQNAHDKLRLLLADEFQLDSSIGGNRRDAEWFPERRSSVLAMDVSGAVAAALLWWRGGVVGSAMFEHCDGAWQSLGGGQGDGYLQREVFGGRPSAGVAGSSVILTVLETSAVRRWAGRRAIGTRNVGWVVSHHLRLASEVDYLKVDERRIEVPSHGHVIIVSTADPVETMLSNQHPGIAAYGADGTRLSELGPNEFVTAQCLLPTGLTLRRLARL